MAHFSDKVVLVTGSSRGIGAAIAKRFAAAGARVAIHGRDPAARARIAADIRQSGGSVFEAGGDLTRASEVDAMRGAVESELGVPDVLVANAGGSFAPPAPLEELTEEGFRASIDGNLVATFLTLKAFLPGMKARRSGNIVTMSSAAARRAHPGSPIGYAVAKAGIELLSQDVAAQAGPYGVRVNCVAPETILTERNEERIPAEQKGKLVDMHPIRRLGTPEDVAEAVFFLSSDASSWITGVVLDVAGGAVLPR